MFIFCSGGTVASGHRSLVMRSVIPGAVVGPIPEFLEHFVEKCRAWWASLDDSKCRHHGIFEIGNTVVTQQFTPVRLTQSITATIHPEILDFSLKWPSLVREFYLTHFFWPERYHNSFQAEFENLNQLK